MDEQFYLQPASEVKRLSCPNAECPVFERVDEGNVGPHGFYKTRAGKRRRYRCRQCGGTFNSTRGAAYFRLQHRRATFDEVATLSVEGMRKSAIARVKGLGWNTVARWLERAAAACREFSDRMNQRARCWGIPGG